MTLEERFEEWKSEQYKDQSTEEKMEFVEHLHNFPKYFEQAYLAGAEPREKRIEELERKLEETEKDLADYQFNYPTIKELEKENGRLEGKIADWESEYIELENLKNNEIAELKIKAQEILKEVIQFYPACCKSTYVMAKELLEEIDK